MAQETVLPSVDKRSTLPPLRRIAAWVGGLAFAHTALAAGALPQGGHYVAGAGTIATQGNTLTITQPNSSRGVIDWSSFSIGNGNTVTIDNGSGATLNRVTGGSPSALLGNLTGTGSVYLINPQGIVVGRNGVITTGGRFVAATLDIADSAFVQGGTLTLAGTSNGKVVNLGKISSTNGDVFLIAQDVVVNGGSVSAPNGTAEYVAGQQVVLYESSSSRQVFVQIGSRGTVLDRGTTEAAQINLEAADGNIYALAGGGSRIRATGTATRDGHIWLVAGNGQVTQQGTLEASNADGSGGTVDTLANALTLGDTATVKAGLWNVSTPSLVVDSTTAAAFTRSLNAGTSVDATATGTNGASGNLDVNADLVWQGSGSLALVSFGNVSIAPGTTLANTGSGSLSLRADAASIDNGGGIANRGTIDWSKSTGIVSLLYDMNGSYAAGTLLGNAGWNAPAYSGLVTQITAYRLVNSVSDLQKIGDDMAGNYALGRSFDASGATFDTLGYRPAVAFTGQFDGEWNTISHLSPNFDPVFSDIGAGGVVRNLNLQENVTTAVTWSTGTGMLAAANHGTIANVFTSGSITSASSDAGDSYAGLVGTNYGLIERSGSSATVSADEFAGGLVVFNMGTITQSYATGSVDNIATHGAAGGLVASGSGTVTQSYASGPVRAVGRGAGGICDGGCSALGSDVYWNAQTTGQTSSGGNLSASNGLTSAQMSDPANFVGWNFGADGAWALPAGATQPVLRWQVTSH